MTDTTRERVERVRSIRETIATHRAAREAETRRRAELPAAHCRVCGGIVGAGDGIRDPEPERNPDVPRGMTWDRTRHGLVIESPPEGADDWRRAHSTCATMGAHDVLAELTGYDLTPREASAVPADVPVAARRALTSPGPWEWVSEAEREALRTAVRRALAETRPSRCKDGACSLCGRQKSMRWVRGPLRWPDGSAAPICGECREVWERRGAPTDLDEIRRVVVELATGYALPIGRPEPYGVRAFCESQAADRDGVADPFGYSDGIADLRLAVWTNRPELAPEALRGDFRRRNAERRAQDATEAAAEREAERLAAW